MHGDIGTRKTPLLG